MALSSIEYEPITHVLHDHDGTHTNVTKEGPVFLTKYQKLLSIHFDAPIKQLHEAFMQQMHEVEKNPTSMWVSPEGYNIAPPVDPYILVGVTAAGLIEKLRSGSLDHMVFDPERLPPPGQVGQLTGKLFNDAYRDTPHIYRPEARQFFDHMTEKYKNGVITNSNPDEVRAKLADLLKIDINGVLEFEGNARKYSFDRNFTQVPEGIELPGFPLAVHLRRKNYFDILQKLQEKGFRPENTAMLGDIYQMDLALPEQFGYRILLVVTGRTPKYEIDHMQELQKEGKGAPVRNYGEILNFIASSNQRKAR